MFSLFQILRISASRGMGLTLYCTLAGFCSLCSSCTFMQNRLAENLKNSDSVRLFRYFCSKSSETFKKRFTPLFESFTRCQRNRVKIFGFWLFFFLSSHFLMVLCIGGRFARYGRENLTFSLPFTHYSPEICKPFLMAYQAFSADSHPKSFPLSARFDLPNCP